LNFRSKLVSLSESTLLRARQWLSRDFKKNAGVSVDEMRTTIGTLGNNLKTQAFTEPLNRLAAYYKHQQEQLKGFMKDAKKLEENLKIIDGWIHDAKGLIHTLTS
jgi:ABC-type transporter Mla subunit MlaD